MSPRREFSCSSRGMVLRILSNRSERGRPFQLPLNTSLESGGGTRSRRCPRSVWALPIATIRRDTGAVAFVQSFAAPGLIGRIHRVPHRGRGLGVRCKNANSHSGDHRDGDKSRAHSIGTLHLRRLQCLSRDPPRFGFRSWRIALRDLTPSPRVCGSLAVAIAIFVGALLAERALYILAGIHVTYRMVRDSNPRERDAWHRGSADAQSIRHHAKNRTLRLCRVAGFLCVLVGSAAQGVSPDRMVAEWMLRMGGSVVLEGQHRAIFDLAELPTSDFHIHTLNFTGITQWAFALEDELRRLSAAQTRRGSLCERPPLVRSAGFAGRSHNEPLRWIAGAGNSSCWSQPVQTYIPFDDAVVRAVQPLPKLKDIRFSADPRCGCCACILFVEEPGSEL